MGVDESLDAAQPQPISPPLDESLLLGRSRAIRRVRDRLRRLARLPWPVRLEGATGSGKSLAARYLHMHSPRSGGPFRPCYLSGLPDDLAIAELMGYGRGAFTGAVRDYPGAFEAANGGTLFLDEIDLTSPHVQIALLQPVESGCVQRIGERRTRNVDVRLVCASNVPLEREVAARHFREDLFARLGEFLVVMPSLKRRRTDIPLLFQYFAAAKAAMIGVISQDHDPTQGVSFSGS